MNCPFFINFTDKFNSILITTYLVLVPLFFSSVPPVAKIVLFFLLIIIFLNSAYYYFCNHKTFIIKKTSAIIHLVFLFLLCYYWLHTYFLSRIPFESKIEFVNILLYVTSFYIFYFASKNQELTKQLQLSFFIVQIFLFILYLFYKEKIIYFFVYNPNILSGYCMFCLLYCSAYIYEDKKMTVITGMNLVLATIFLFLLKNFSSWLVILMFILFVMIKNLFVLFFSLCSLVFIAVVLNPVSFFDRIVWFIIGIRMWKDNFLFGVGPGNFKFFYPSYVINIPFLPSIATIFTHNYFVQMAAELGVIWLIFFLLFLYTIMKNVKIGSKKYLFPLCGVLIQNFVDYNLLIPQNSILFFIFFSLFLSDMDKKECQCSVNIVFEQNKYRYFLFIIMCLCLYGIFFSIKIEKIVRLCSSPAEADMLTAVNKDKTCWQAYKQLAMYAIENKEVDKAQQLLLKTLKYNPADAETYLYLAVINFRFGNKKNGYKFLSQAVKLNPRNAYRYVKQIQNI